MLRGCLVLQRLAVVHWSQYLQQGVLGLALARLESTYPCPYDPVRVHRCFPVGVLWAFLGPPPALAGSGRVKLISKVPPTVRVCGANSLFGFPGTSWRGRPPRGRWDGEKTPEAPDYFTPEETSALVAANPIYPVRMAMRIMLRTWLRVSECLSLCPANHQPEAGGDGEQGETGPRGPHPRRLGGVPGGSGVVSRAKDGERPLIDQAVAGNSLFTATAGNSPLS